MKRWRNCTNTNEECPAVDAFILELIEVCKKHNMSIEHEDHYGAFQVNEFSDSSADWLMNAQNLL